MAQAISHVMRLREPEERFTLLNYTITTLPSMHVRGFKKTATNIVDYYRTQGDACHDQELRSMVREKIGKKIKNREKSKASTRKRERERERDREVI